MTKSLRGAISERGLLWAYGLRSEPLHLGLKAPWEDGGGCIWCGENVLCSLGHLNTCSPVGGAVWGDLEGMALLQKAYPWGWALRFPRFSSLPSSPSLLPLCVLRAELSAAAPVGRLLPLTAFHHNGDGVLSLQNREPQTNPSSSKLCWPWCVISATGKRLTHPGDSKDTKCHLWQHSKNTAVTCATNILDVKGTLRTAGWGTTHLQLRWKTRFPLD